MAHVKTISDEVLLKIAEDIDMVADLCNFVDVEGQQSWNPWRIRVIVSKLDDLGLIKRPIAEVYYSSTYRWCIEVNGIEIKYELLSKRAAYEYCRALGYEPIDSKY